MTLRHLVVVAAIVALALTLLCLRLARAPLPLPWLGTHVATALSPQDGTLRATVGATFLAWDRRERAIEVEARAVEVRDGDGQHLLTIERLRVTPRLADLLRLRFTVSAIDFVRPTMVVMRRPDGSWNLALGGPHAATDGDHPLPMAIARAVLAHRFDAIGIDDGELTVADARGEPFITATDVDVVLRAVDGRLRATFELLVADAAAAAASAPGHLPLSGSIEFDPGSDAGSVDLAVTTPRVEVGTLTRHWPRTQAAAARAWIAAHVGRGTFEHVQARVEVASRADDPTAITIARTDVQARFHGVEATVHPDVPTLRAAAGTVRCTIDGCRVDVERGRIGDLAIERGQVRLAHLGSAGATAALQARVRGPARPLATLLDREPLRYARRLGIDPASVEGSAAVEFALDVALAGAGRAPLLRSASGTGVGLAVPDLLGAWDVREGDLHFDVRADVLDVTGTAQVEGVPVRLSWQEPVGSAAAARRASFQGRIDRPGRRRLGLDAGAWLAGPVDFDGRLVQTASDRHRLELRVDLAQATIALPVDALAKPPGEAGSLAATIDLAGVSLAAVESLSATIGASTVRASVTRRATGSGWGRLRAEAALRARGRDATADCVLTAEPAGTGHRVSFEAADLGHFMAAVGMTTEVRGGSMRWTGEATLTGRDAVLDGHLTATRYTVTRSPLLTRLARLTSVPGIQGMLSGTGLAFDDTRARLGYGHGRVTLDDGLAIGPSIALHVRGTYDVPGDDVDLEGDLAPSYYGINRAGRRVPIIGSIVTGGGTGIQAVHFTARGPAQRPAVRVDPLASVAPGVFRDLVRPFSRRRRPRAAAPTAPGGE